jgi:hypothetical protein
MLRYLATVTSLLMVAVAILGAQAPAADVPDVGKMVAAAKTPADHRALAEHYEREAAAARASAEMHRKMAAEYRKAGGPAVKAQLPEHCEGLVKVYESAAKDFEAMARAHREMAEAKK